MADGGPILISADNLQAKTLRDQPIWEGNKTICVGVGSINVTSVFVMRLRLCLQHDKIHPVLTDEKI